MMFIDFISFRFVYVCIVLHRLSIRYRLQEVVDKFEN